MKWPPRALLYKLQRLNYCWSQPAYSTTVAMREEVMNSKRYWLGLSLTLGLCVMTASSCVAVSMLNPPQKNNVRLGLTLGDKPASTVSDADVEQTIKVLRARLSQFGLPGAAVERSSTEGEHLAVFVPEVEEFARLKSLLIASGRLELTPVAKGSILPYATQK